MKRTEKYPNTDCFEYCNANPKNRITGDCVFRAIATACGLTWADVVLAMAEISIRSGYVINGKNNIDRYLTSLGWEKQKQPKKPDGTKYTGKEFCEKFPDIDCVAMIGGHHITCIKSGKIHDIWNCSSKCIGNFWTKK